MVMKGLMNLISSDASESQRSNSSCVYKGRVVCQKGYAYSPLMRAEQLSRDRWLVWPHHNSSFFMYLSCKYTYMYMYIKQGKANEGTRMYMYMSFLNFLKALRLLQCSKLRPDTGQFPVKLATCLDITHFDQPKCPRKERAFTRG